MTLGAEEGRGADGGGGEKVSALRSSISIERSSRFLPSAMAVVAKEDALEFVPGVGVRLERGTDA